MFWCNTLWLRADACLSFTIIPGCMFIFLLSSFSSRLDVVELRQNSCAYVVVSFFLPPIKCCHKSLSVEFLLPSISTAVLFSALPALACTRFAVSLSARYLYYY